MPGFVTCGPNEALVVSGECRSEIVLSLVLHLLIAIWLINLYLTAFRMLPHPAAYGAWRTRIRLARHSKSPKVGFEV